MKDRPNGRHARMEKYILRKAFDLADQPYLLKPSLSNCAMMFDVYIWLT